MRELCDGVPPPPDSRFFSSCSAEMVAHAALGRASAASYDTTIPKTGEDVF